MSRNNAAALIKLAHKRFGTLTLDDAKVLRATALGERLVLSTGKKKPVNAELIRWLCADPAIHGFVSNNGIQLEGGSFSEGLNLDTATVPFPLAFFDCEFLKKPNLMDAHTRFLCFKNCDLPGLRASRLNVTGALKFNGSRFGGQVRLFGAKITGNVEFDGAIIRAFDDRQRQRRQLAIHAGGMTVGGNLLLRDEFVAVSTVRLTGSLIARNLDCRAGFFCAPMGLTNIRTLMPEGKIEERYAIFIDGSEIKGRVHFTEKFFSYGEIHIAGAKIHGDLVCCDAHFCSPGGNALVADGAEVDGTAFFCAGPTWTEYKRHSRTTPNWKKVQEKVELPENATAWLRSKFEIANHEPKETIVNGIIKFPHATLSEGLYFKDVRFDRTEGDAGEHTFPATIPEFFLKRTPSNGETSVTFFVGVDLRYCEIGGKFEWKNITYSGVAREVSRVNLFFAKAKLLDSDVMDRNSLESWPERGNLNLEGFVYDGIDELHNVKGIGKGREFEEGWIEKKVHRDLLRFLGLNRIFGLDNEYALLQWLKLSFPPQGQRGLEPEKNQNTFTPQPYTQLIKVLRGAGHHRRARQVILAREKLRRITGTNFWARHWGKYQEGYSKREGDKTDCCLTHGVKNWFKEAVLKPNPDPLGFFQWVASWFLYLTTGYGHRPQRALYWLFAAWLGGVVIMVNAKDKELYH